jgi:polysaccharide biosynthesis transport protein
LNNQKSQVDLKSYWSIITRRKTLVILPLMIVPLIALALTYFMSPTYVSTVTVLLSDTKIIPSTVQQEIEGRGGGWDMTTLQERQNSYYNQFTSTKYLRRLIATLNIPIGIDIRKLVAETKSRYPEISENDLAENMLADYLRRNVAVVMRANNLIEVSFTAEDPVSAQKRGGALADIFIEENLAGELAGVSSSISFSEEQLAFYKDKLKSAEDKLREYRQGLLASSFGQDTSSSNIREIASALQVLDLDITNQQDHQAGLRSAIDAENIDLTSVSLPAEIDSQKSKLLGISESLSQLLSNYNWRDVKVLNLNEESRLLIEQITSQIHNWVIQQFTDKPAATQNIIEQYFTGNIILDYNRAKRASLDRYIGQTKSRLAQDPATAITIERLQSEIDSYKRFYDLFVSHSQNAAINQSAKKVEAEAKFTIIKPASMPLSPDSPKRLRILLMGIGLGLTIGLGAIMLVELLDNSFKKVEDVNEYLHLSVLGTIPRMDLPFSSLAKKRVPIAIGVSISFLLVILIIFLNFKKNG